MKEVYYIYNNEAIASCIFLAYLQNVKSIDMAQSCLILPFLLDDRTVTYFMNIQDDDDNSLEYIVNNRPKLFASFNKTTEPIDNNLLFILLKPFYLDLFLLICAISSSK